MVQTHVASNQGQPKTAAAIIGVVTDAGESLENLLSEFGRHAGSGVVDLDPRDIGVCADREPNDSTPVSVGVVQQIGNQAHEAAPVGYHD